jgi:hypothetical protein
MSEPYRHVEKAKKARDKTNIKRKILSKEEKVLRSLTFDVKKRGLVILKIVEIAIEN